MYRRVMRMHLFSDVYVYMAARYGPRFGAINVKAVEVL